MEGTHAGPRHTRIPRTPHDNAHLEPVRRQLAEQGLAPRSVKLYVNHIARAHRWATEEGLDLATIDAGDLGRYADLVPKTHSTRAQVRSALAHYWRITGREAPPLWAIRVPSKPRMRCRALEDHEAAALLTVGAVVGGRLNAALLLGLYQGLRREEIATLQWYEFSDDGWLNVVGKGSVSGTLPVHPAVRAALDELPRAGRWVFPGRFPDRPVCAATVWRWVRDLAEVAAQGVIAPHRLRHTCIAKANEETGDLRAVQEFARHARPETTAGYTRVSTRRLLAVRDAIDYGTAA